MADIEDFKKLEIRVGKINNAELLPNPKYTTHKLSIDFGPEIGTKISGARLPDYGLDELRGKQVVCVINFPPRQIGALESEVLTLGLPDENKECVLISPDKEVPLGGRLY